MTLEVRERCPALVVADAGQAKGNLSLMMQIVVSSARRINLKAGRGRRYYSIGRGAGLPSCGFP